LYEIQNFLGFLTVQLLSTGNETLILKKSSAIEIPYYHNIFSNIWSTCPSITYPVTMKPAFSFMHNEIQSIHMNYRIREQCRQNVKRNDRRLI